MKTPKFQIGDRVRVKAVTKTEYFYKNKKDFVTITYDENPIEGVICGATNRYSGTREWDSSDSWSDNGYYYFVQKERKTLWQVKQGITNKPIEALEEDIELIHPCLGTFTTLPWRK